MSFGVGRRCTRELALLWLWCRPVAVEMIRPLVWELPYAILKSKKKKKMTVCACTKGKGGGGVGGGVN